MFSFVNFLQLILHEKMVENYCSTKYYSVPAALYTLFFLEVKKTMSYPLFLNILMLLILYVQIITLGVVLVKVCILLTQDRIARVYYITSRVCAHACVCD